MTAKESLALLKVSIVYAKEQPKAETARLDDGEKEAVKAIEGELERDGIVNDLIRNLLSSNLSLVEKILPNGVERKIVDGFGCTITRLTEKTFRALESLGVTVVRTR